MIAFSVAHNDQHVCTASVGQIGVLTASLVWVRRVGASLPPVGEAEQVELELNVGALHSPTNEHLRWDTPQVCVGDRVEITVHEITDPTQPTDRYENDGAAVREAQKRHVRRMAAMWGCKIDENPKHP